MSLYFFFCCHRLSLHMTLMQKLKKHLIMMSWLNSFVRLGLSIAYSKRRKKNFKEESPNPLSKLMAGIRSSTRFKLELSSSIGALKRMKLKKPFDELIPNTIYFYKNKIELYEETIKISKEFVDTAPRPDVDYSKMVARMPEITASIEYIDESIFQSMVLVFALLIDEKPDSEGHMSHLNITKAQRQKLIDNINDLFAESLDKENKNLDGQFGSFTQGIFIEGL